MVVCGSPVVGRVTAHGRAGYLMGIDTWMAATPAPHYLDGTIDDPLSDAGAA